ncbi:MAG: hypothetical protein ACYTHM_17935 [Planctomycetota bacterium]|jgi:hypothetical protein
MNKKRILMYCLWIAGIALILYGALFRAFPVLDKPLSRDAAKQGVRIRFYTEAQLTSAVSTDKVELTEEGILRTRPDTGFCES